MTGLEITLAIALAAALGYCKYWRDEYKDIRKAFQKFGAEHENMREEIEHLKMENSSLFLNKCMCEARNKKKDA